MMNFFLPVVIIFFFSVMAHEYAHGWVAYQLGDPTAKQAGRLTLNPFKHIDIFGTILFPGALFIMNSPIIFGWAKPVPVDFRRLKDPKKGMMLVSLAGPMTNLLIAFLFSRLLGVFVSEGVQLFFQYAVMINLVLAFFNLIPIPPLDGSHIIISVLPNRQAYYYSRLEKYGFIIVFVLLYFGVFRFFIWPLVLWTAALLGVS
jgi:Zn-dependent protease